MDFGLVRVKEQPGGITREGLLAGTPEYMSPEQIREPERVDERSDVYGLGVTLYEMLTGEVPFRGTPHMVLQQLLRDEPPPPRRMNDAIPRDLETICTKAMAKEPGRRYASAALLRDDLRRWLRGEVIHARPVGRIEKAWRWCRRNPELTGVTAALVLSIIAGFATVTALWLRADWLYHDAQQKKKESDDSFREALQAINDSFVLVSENKLFYQPGMEPVRKDLMEASLRYYLRLLGQRGNDPAVRRELAKAYDHAATITMKIGSNADALKLQERSRELCEALVRENPDSLEYREWLSTCHDHLGTLQLALGRHAEAIESYGLSRASMAELVRADRGNSLYRAALAGRLSNLANTYERVGRLEEAVKLFEEAIEHQRQVVAQKPELPWCREHLGKHYYGLAAVQAVLGHLPQVRESLDEARTVQEKLVGEYPRVAEFRADLGMTYARLGVLHAQTGSLPEAIRLFKEAVKLLEVLARDHPQMREYRFALADASNSLGAYLKEEQPAEALPHLERARDELARLRREVPEQMEYVSGHAGALNNLGMVLEKLGRNEHALAAYREAFDLQTKALLHEPGSPQRRAFLVHHLTNWTRLQEKLNQAQGALDAHEAGRRVLKEVAQVRPNDLQVRSELGAILNNWGMALARHGRPAEAEKAYREAIEHQRVAYEGTPQPKFARQFLRNHHFALALVYLDAKRFPEAVPALRECVKLTPANPADHYHLAGALAQCASLVAEGKSDLSEAERAEQTRLGDEAMAALRECLRNGYPKPHTIREDPAFEALRSRKDFQQLVSDLAANAGQPPP